MNATLTATRLISVREPSPDRRAVLLAWLAATVTEDAATIPPAGVSVLLAAWAHDSLKGAALDDAFAEYLEAVRLEQDTESGWVSPAQVCPEVVNGERSEVAREMTRYATRDALSVLVNGNQIGGTA